MAPCIVRVTPTAIIGIYLAHSSFVNLVSYYPLDQLAGNTSIVDNIGTSNGSLFNAAAYIVSGAEVGEESAYSYAALPSASLTLSNGEKLTATSAPGNLKGIHVYAVNTTPNTTTGIVGVGGNDRYFGVHVVGSATPQYDAVYDYTGNSFVTDETALQLYRRNSNNITTWDLVTATKNTANNTFTFTGQFTEYMLGNVGGVLPVTLLNFTGVSQAGKNLLSWKTTNETAFSHFEVGVSNDATNFNTIGKVTAGTNNYAFTHFNPLAGNHFYRLKMVDKDGRFSFSGIIKLVQNQSNKLSVFPNPAKDFITINSGRKQTAVITNTIGKVMSVLQLVNGSQSISTITWAHGIYFIKTTEEVIKLVIQK